jgi:uncharacterized RDD family membrane protein YckC
VPFIVVVLIFTARSLTTSHNGVVHTSTSSGSMLVRVLMYLIMVAIYFYNRCYLGGQGQSFGKKALNLVLVAEATGRPVGTGKAFLRDVCHILDSIPCDIGWLFPIWDAKRQTFADKLMTTVVLVKG